MRRHRLRIAVGVTGAITMLLITGGCDSPSIPSAALSDAPAVTPSTTDDPKTAVRLSRESIRQAEIRLATVTESLLVPEVQAYGRVLDAAPLGDAMAGWRAAQVVSRTAESELSRVRLLARDAQNASVRALEGARAAAARAGADLERAEVRVITLVGPALATNPQLPSIVRRITRREAALIRVDVPGGGPPPDPDRGAHLLAYPERNRELAARFVGPAPNADPWLQGFGLLFLVEKNPPPVGTRISATVRVAGKTKSGVDVPAEALVRDAGGLFVFVAGEPGQFLRRRVVVHARTRGRWFVEDGLAVGERVVVSGAGELLSAERLSSPWRMRRARTSNP